MASSVSPWTTMASNTQDGAGASVTQNVNIAQTATGASGINAHVRSECLVWLDGTDPIYTNNFDFPINGDLTIILNGTLNTIHQDAGDIDVDMEGSLDGTNYIKLADVVTWNAGGASETETVGQAVYDYDGKGRMPFMRLMLDCGSDANGGTPSTAQNVKVTIIKHNI
jgi:hypothetical protein